MNKKYAFLIVLTLMISLFTTSVGAMTRNTLSFTVNPTRDKDFSQDIGAASSLRLKAEDAGVPSGAMCLLSLTPTAKWTYDEADLSGYFSDIGGGNYTSLDTLTNQQDFSYTILVVSERQIQITFNEELELDNYLDIPLIVKIDGASEASVTVSDGDSYGITSGTYVFANQGHVDDADLEVMGTGKTEGQAIIGTVEVMVSAGLGDAEVELVLPAGFTFDDKSKDKVGLSGEGSYSSARLANVGYNSSRTTMFVRFEGAERSTSSGKLTITGIYVNASDTASEGDVMMYFSVGAYDIRNEKFKFAEYTKAVAQPEPAPEPEQEPAQEKVKINVSATSGSKTIIVNGEALELEVAPFNDDAGRMLVPLRFIANAFGLSDDSIEWDAVTKVAKLNFVMPDKRAEITFTIGSPVYTVNGVQKTMDTTAVIKDGYTFIPVRYVADAMGLTVSYDAETKTASFSN